MWSYKEWFISISKQSSVLRWCSLFANCCFFQDIHKHCVERPAYNEPVVKITNLGKVWVEMWFFNLCLSQDILTDVGTSVDWHLHLTELCQMRVWSLRKLFLFHLYALLSVVTYSSTGNGCLLRAATNTPKLIKSYLYIRLNLQFSVVTVALHKLLCAF